MVDRISALMGQETAATGMARAAQMLGRGEEAGQTKGAAANFSSMLSEAIETVHQSQQSARALQRDYQAGDSRVGIEETMVAMNKASLSIQMLTQARNKVVAAYNDVMNMPV